MNLKYVFDIKEETTKAIGENLRAYNNSKTGDLENGSERFYLVKDDKLYGAIDTYFFWETLGFTDVYYDTLDTLKILTDLARDKFKDKTRTFECSTYDKKRLADLQAANFKICGEIKDRPKGEIFYELVNYDYEPFNIENNFSIFTSETVDEKYKNEFEQAIKRYNEAIGNAEEKEIVQYIVKDGEELIAGIYGYIELNYAYASLLWVNEDYRKHSIGTKLMDLFEEKVYEMGHRNYFLGTAEFQARGFYEKRGYKVVGEMHHCPKDCTVYTMVKNKLD